MKSSSCKTIYIIIIATILFSTNATPIIATSATESDVSNTTRGTEGNVSAPKVETLKSPLQVESIGALVQKFVEVFSYIVVLLAVLMLIWVGFKYILYSAQGNASEITKLHSWLLWIVVGVAIVIAARVMVLIVINTIEKTGTVSPSITNSAKKAASGN